MASFVSMQPIRLYKVFTHSALHFNGNTAAVVHLEKPIPEDHMQSISSDLNQPATTFLWQENGLYKIRWFAPDAEIGLCGHGAFAAFAFLKETGTKSAEIILNHNLGEITGDISGEQIAMFMDPIPVKKRIPVPDPILEGLNIPILDMYETTNKHIILTESENVVRNMKPDFSKLRESNIFGYAVTAPGDEVDFVSRTIVPHVQQLEDHATGSSHAMLTPFWSDKFGKSKMEAKQLSPRGGYFHCRFENDQVILSGNHELVSSGKINI